MIDIGANLTHRSFHRDLHAVLARAAAAGVERIVVTGTSVEGSAAAARLATEHPGVLFATSGVHPHHAGGCDGTTIEGLRQVARQAAVVAVGECGLDYNRDFSPRSDQVEWFEAQLELAVETGLPVFLHERDAATEFVATMKRYRDRIADGVVHCFTGDGEALRAYLDLDLYVGITGWICDERRGRHLQELVREIPDDRLMVETDAPYLVPRTLRPQPSGRRNEPAFLMHVLDTVAVCRDQPSEQLAEATTRNAERFFRLDQKR